MNIPASEELATMFDISTIKRAIQYLNELESQTGALTDYGATYRKALQKAAWIRGSHLH